MYSPAKKLQINFFLILKSLSTPRLGKFDEAYFGDWKGFLQRGMRNDKEVYDYVVWRKGTGEPLVLTFIVKGRALSGDIIREIVPSVTLDFSPKAAKEYFQEGLNLFNQTKYEEARFSFANAVTHEWENPQYNFYLGYTFFKTEDWSTAKKYFKKAISLRPDYTEAQRLLKEVENKEFNEKVIP